MKFYIEGQKTLKGELYISGAKNSALAIMPATILLEKPVILKNIPDVEDIRTMSELLKILGVKVKKINKNTLEIDPRDINKYQAPYELVSKMRASIYVLGPLLVRFKKAIVYMPGGCSFGPRPIDFHIEGLKKLGANIKIEHGNIVAIVDEFKSAHIQLPFKSVGATIHLIMTSALLKDKKITISNCALEPEVVDLAHFLNKAGAKIYGVGYDEVIIEGVNKLEIDEYEIIPDRIEAGTYLVAGSFKNNKILLRNVIVEHLEPVIDKLLSIGVKLKIYKNEILVEGIEKPRSIEIQTQPFPGFPTDMQAQFMTLLSIADGVSIIKENIYPNRFAHAYELMRMSADIKIVENVAIVKGVNELTSAIVNATDLRASASLVLAGLIANGNTIIENIEHIDRGYEDIEIKFNKLGAKIERII
ncbi:MAG: UDP-N-acetylglucosamine 1-carboxyvinyltransferase [candidate division WOR-3 bacterium]|nr:UDP-N-acetylglucosamine 1-carboxyvinyltransferase [candidate division WOR-3 bacterium]MCX7947844.1 UDP-N-acetylglucosamine 1-carboxyvinyltransferase [candidate division WOR-3 bacterium]MDW8150666.1 UDP-N-acetylglucosamine 1-carboxyvinyltransferase [candidate division WOR-3 bacterium]